MSSVCGTTGVGLGALNHPKSMTMITSAGVTVTTASVISSTSATKSPYSASKNSSGAASNVAGTTHVAFSDSVGGDAVSSAAAPSGELGERYMSNTLNHY